MLKSANFALDFQIPQRRRFNWQGDDFLACVLRGQLVQQRILRAAAGNVQLLPRLTRQALQFATTL